MSTVKKTNEKKFNLRTESWSYEKFNSIEPYNKNRDVEPRVSKVVKLLSKKYLPIHSVVTVGVAVKPFSNYKKGEMFRLDGNTRAEAFRVKPELIPTVPFNVMMIDIESKKEAEEIYYSIDSSDSVETAAHKVTGFLRERNYNAKTKNIKNGVFKGALLNACKYVHNENGDLLQKADFDTMLDYFWNELVYIDQSGVINSKDGRVVGNVTTSLLLICKKYGTDNERVKLLINNLKNFVTECNDQTQVDGVHYVLNDLHRIHKQDWTKSQISISIPIICKILHSLDKFVIGETLNKSNRKMSEKKLMEFYQNYLSN